MSNDKPAFGTIGWLDLTVDDAPAVRGFYEKVAGWTATPVSMGDYDDWAVGPADGDPVAGVCHRRGGNANQPQVWLPYIVVEDLDACLAAAEKHGGAVVTPPREAGEARYAVVEDPAGAMCALYQP